MSLVLIIAYLVVGFIVMAFASGMELITLDDGNSDFLMMLLWPIIVAMGLIIGLMCLFSDLGRRAGEYIDRKKGDKGMEYPDKEVRYDLYCKTCKHNDVDDYDEPCFSCLDEPVREYSHKPVNWEERE